MSRAPQLRNMPPVLSVAVGGLLLFLAVVCNIPVLTSLLFPDGEVETPLFRWLIISSQGVLAVSGLVSIFWRRSRGAQALAMVWMAVLGVAATALIFDRVVGAVLPSAGVIRIVHPRNHSSFRWNVEFTHLFETNEQGLRDRQMPLAKAEGEVRVVVLGDSYTEGTGVELEQVWHSLVEEALSTAGRRVELINCGFSGTGPLVQGRALLHVCLGYAPDALLIATYPNDLVETPPDATAADLIELPGTEVLPAGVERIAQVLMPRTHVAWVRLEEVLRGPREPAYAVDVLPRPLTLDGEDRNRSADELLQPGVMEGLLSAAQGLPPHANDFVTDVVNEARSRGMREAEIAAWQARLPAGLVDAARRQMYNDFILGAGLLHAHYWSDSFGAAPQRFAALERVLDGIVNEVRARGIPVAQVFFPSGLQIDPETHVIWERVGTEIHPEWLTQTTRIEELISEWAQKHDVAHLNLTGHFRALQVKDGERLYFPLDGHWTPLGNRVAAEQVAPWLSAWLRARGLSEGN